MLLNGEFGAVGCGDLLVKSGVDSNYRPLRDRRGLVKLDRNVIKAHLPIFVPVPVKHVKGKGFNRLFEFMESFLIDVIVSSNRELKNY